MGKDAKLFVRRLLQGALVGSGAILPGVSGGVLCVTFGLYKPLMALLAHPRKNLPRYFKLLLPVAIGIVLGFWGLSGLISGLFAAAAEPAAALFAGLMYNLAPKLPFIFGGCAFLLAAFFGVLYIKVSKKYPLPKAE